MSICLLASSILESRRGSVMTTLMNEDNTCQVSSGISEHTRTKIHAQPVCFFLAFSVRIPFFSGKIL